ILTSNFILFYIFLKYFVSFIMYVHPFTTALKKKSFSTEQVAIALFQGMCFNFSQIKENKLCTHSQFFTCRQTSLFII
uniref:Uncharacterized protein n=1 Tax=Ailuropoda melanoleuca TaxID=9646 RepID=A0A7N5KQI1_AILME